MPLIVIVLTLICLGICIYHEMCKARDKFYYAILKEVKPKREKPSEDEGRQVF